MSEAEEQRRVLPVVEGLAAAGLFVSIDTMRAGTAEKAVAAGARMVNDVSGGLADPDMVPLVAGLELPYVVMHWRGHSAAMQSRAVYDDVVTDVLTELRDRVDAVVAGGVARDLVVVDPGLGFAKKPEHSWALLRHLDRLAELDRPVLIGASRKGFLGRLLAAPDGTPRLLDERDDATTAVTAVAAYAGAWCVRVHTVRPSVDAALVAAAFRGRFA